MRWSAGRRREGGEPHSWPFWLRVTQRGEVERWHDRARGVEADLLTTARRQIVSALTPNVVWHTLRVLFERERLLGLLRAEGVGGIILDDPVFGGQRGPGF